MSLPDTPTPCFFPCRPLFRFSGLILLEILRLLKDFFVDFIPVYGRIAVLGKQDDQIDFQFGLDIVAFAPVCIRGLVVDNDFHLLGKDDKLVFGVFKIVLDGQGFQLVFGNLIFPVFSM